MNKKEKKKRNPQIVKIITERSPLGYGYKYLYSYIIKCKYCGDEIWKSRYDAQFCNRSHATMFKRKEKKGIEPLSD